MIKKTLFLLLTLTGFLISCQKESDVQGDIDEIKARLDAIEKGKSIATITFEGTNMVLTYNTGEKVTLPMPQGLKGDKGDKGDSGTNGTNGTNGKDGVNGSNGTNGKDGVNGTNGTNGVDGKDGVGITSVDYDSTTGILTIKLSNGNVSSFQVVSSSDGSLSAVLLADTKGKMLIKSIYAGIVPYAEATYDANYNMNTFTSSTVNNGVILKSGEIIKKYSGSTLVGVDLKKYATKKEIKFNYTVIYQNYTDTSSLTNRGSYFTIPIGDGLYNIYVFQYQSSTYNSGVYTNTWVYRKFPAVKSSIDISYGYYKYNENIVYWVGENLNVTGSTDSWYRVSSKYVKTGVTNIGDLISSVSYDVETDANGLVKKVSDPIRKRSIQFTYNNANLVTKAQEYIDGVAGRYMTYEYNTSNWLVSIKEIIGGTTKEVVKNVFDEKGNPIEIYVYQGVKYSDDWNFDPWSNPVDPWTEGSFIRDAGLYLYAKIEYDNYKNFFGNTIGAIFPTLSGYKIVNAPKRISLANGVGFGSIEYKDFNDLGYPKTMVANTVGDGQEQEGTVRIEFAIDYIQKN